MSKWQGTYLHSQRMVGNCSHSGFRACSYSLCSVWAGSAWGKSNERELESIISFSSYSSVLCNVRGWGHLEATAVSIPFHVPWIFSLLFFAFVTIVEGQVEQHRDWESSQRSRERLLALASADCNHHLCPQESLMTVQEHLTCPRHMAWNGWVLLTWWRGETEVGIEWAKKGQAQMSAKISLDSPGSQPNNYRCLK